MSPINMLHLSSLAIWDLGQNKGRVSTFLPLKAFVDKGYNVLYLTSNKYQKTGYLEGIKVDQVCMIPNSVDKPYIGSFIRFLLFPIITFCYLFKVYIVYYLKKRISPQIIYAHTTYEAFAAYVLSKLLGAKYVLRLYGVSNIKDKTILHKILHFDFFLAFLLKADLYILTNDGTSAKEVAMGYGVPEKKIYFLKNGVDKRLAYKSINYSLKREIAPKQEKILITVSRLVKWKQVDLIIRAIPVLIELNKKIKLIIVGDGDEMENLKLLAQKLGVINYIHFTGAVEQSKVTDYIIISDLFISMNALSSVSNPVLEAMICKKAVIALNTGKTVELIKNNETGFLLDINEIDKLPYLINEILNDDERRNTIAENAQKYVINEWPCWEERIDYEINVIDNLLKKL